ncbi:multi-sensor hybrid histidine kinase [Plesiocystis pacifica SIR-1]|uniref:histidine kinase n=1 Tax=Plesiocystis pacifica SIR-1 TaxID=391625 RepID=A6GD09_9BACT|nr:response regulator [Plesiocystis pacifica]EDM76247.1 multi-sensor hybrid histidine kinase [Plesiocystis pacifica SIR-1]
MDGSAKARGSREHGMRTLLWSSSDAVLVYADVDPRRARFIDANPKALDLFGLPRERLAALPEAELLRWVDEERVELRLGDGASLTVVATQVHPEGTGERWLLLRDPTARRVAERTRTELRDSNRLLRAFTDAAFEAVFMYSGGVIRLANRAAESYARVEPGGLIGRQLADFIAPRCRGEIVAQVRSGSGEPFETWAVRADGQEYPVEVRPHTTTVTLEGGTLHVAAMRDLTEERALQEQLRRTQRMEALGRVAGGVAHDFNNLLSVVLNATELACLDLEPRHPSRVELQAVLDAARRGTELTRQLLAFGRRSTGRAGERATPVIDASEVVASMHAMLRRLLGSNIALELELDDRDLGQYLQLEASQLEQLILNLALNARDAMLARAIDGPAHTANTLSLQLRRRELGEVELRALDCPGAPLHPGPHLELRVRDQGTGMDAETRARIFEPFFTTKPAGEGTGLGLATVFAVVQEARGAITVDSELGVGTTFTCLLPLADPPESAIDTEHALHGEPELEPELDAAETAEAPRRSVLVVEDEAPVRRIVAALLQRAGYTVVEAEGVEAALELARARPVDVLLTDVVMPVFDGLELAKQLCSNDPQLRVVFTSGYTRDELLGANPRWAAAPFLDKPVTPAALLGAIEAALAGPSPSLA